jgi:hypothetical protein
MRILAATPADADPTIARIIGDMATDTSGLQTWAFWRCPALRRQHWC